jgi:hypothetical protein
MSGVVDYLEMALCTCHILMICPTYIPAYIRNSPLSSSTSCNVSNSTCYLQQYFSNAVKVKLEQFNLLRPAKYDLEAHQTGPLFATKLV